MPISHSSICPVWYWADGVMRKRNILKAVTEEISTAFQLSWDVACGVATVSGMQVFSRLIAPPWSIQHTLSVRPTSGGVMDADLERHGTNDGLSREAIYSFILSTKHSSFPSVHLLALAESREGNPSCGLSRAMWEFSLKDCRWSNCWLAQRHGLPTTFGN